MSIELAVPAGNASELVIPNEFSALRQMTDWLDATIRALHIPERLIFDFDLCANEAVTNVISYAYPQNGSHRIALRLYRDDERVCLEIADDGVPFNPLERPPREQPDSIEEAEIGGLGVDLIRSFMKECRYARRDGLNVLTLVARDEG